LQLRPVKECREWRRTQAAQFKVCREGIAACLRGKALRQIDLITVTFAQKPLDRIKRAPVT